MTLALDERPPVTRARASIYESGAQTRRTLGWRAPTTSPNSALLGSLTTIRDRSRNAIRNDPFAQSVVDKLVSNVIGTGIKPQSTAMDAAFRAKVQALWLRWTDESDADGVLDWYGQLSQATRCFLEAGECFIRLRPRLASDGLSVPLQVQVLEPELCPHDFNQPGRSGNNVRAGIEFDRIGRRVQYHFYASRAGALLDYEPWNMVTLAAKNVIHFYDPRRPGQLRGLPHLTSVLITLHELDKFNDAALLRQQLANMFVAFVKSDPSVDGEMTNPLTGLSRTPTTERESLGLEPGLFQRLDPGEEVEFSKPPEAGQTYAAFMRQQLLAVAAGAGVPYEVITGDMSKVNDRTVRVILHEFRRRIMAMQHQIVAFQVCRRVWTAWMDAAMFSGALDVPAGYFTDRTPWTSVKWVPQGWPYLHPVQDVQAQSDAIRNGFTSRAAVVSEQGEDAEQIDREQAADNTRADELGLSYDSDGRKASSGTAAATDPTSEPDSTTDGEDGATNGDPESPGEETA